MSIALICMSTGLFAFFLFLAAVGVKRVVQNYCLRRANKKRLAQKEQAAAKGNTSNNDGLDSGKNANVLNNLDGGLGGNPADDNENSESENEKSKSVSAVDEKDEEPENKKGDEVEMMTLPPANNIASGDPEGMVSINAARLPTAHASLPPDPSLAVALDDHVEHDVILPS
jgi:hypothetical protein